MVDDEEYDSRVNTQPIEQNGFKMIERLDETSRTVVWKAIQISLDRTVIIRVLKPDAAANPSEVDHFLTIARRFARIKSDSLAAVFDIVSKGDLHYVVMEYVEGPTLEQLLAQHGPLPVEQILRIAASLITSLDQMWGTAHIVHRNLKSATIRLDPRGVAKITDFGLAIVAGPGVDATAMDGGHIVGTPCFLSPEQAQGTHMLNTQSDMYALGAVLYHLSTGKVPFEELEVFAILTAHVKQQIPPPHRLNHTIPVTFSWLVHRLMMKNPNSRYADWNDVLLDIRSMLAGTQPTCIRPDEEYRSTIAMDFDENDAGGSEEDGADSGPHIRLNRKEKSDKIVAYQGKRLFDEHANEIRRNEQIMYLVCWSLLAIWLALVFWFRAFYQAVPNRPDIPNPLTQLNNAVAQFTESLEELKPLPDKVDLGEPQSPPPTPEPSTPLPPVAPEPVSAPPTPAPLPVTNPAAAATPALPAGIPVALRQGLAQALANADFATARQLAHTSTERFQEKQALLALLDQIPTPESLVEEYLKAQVGKQLTFEHNGKQRTVILRGVENGVVQVEANGRGAELVIDKLTDDEKLCWMNRPKDAAQFAAYCVTLMRSSRRDEVDTQAANCPLLTPVLLEAASRVPAASATPRAE